MDPNVKILLIVRDPVKRLISEYNQHKYNHMRDSSNTKFPEFEEYIFLDGNQLNIAKQVKIGKVFVLINDLSVFLY